jgi:hypothetical protein
MHIKKIIQYFLILFCSLFIIGIILCNFKPIAVSIISDSFVFAFIMTFLLPFMVWLILLLFMAIGLRIELE